MDDLRLTSSSDQPALLVGARSFRSVPTPVDLVAGWVAVGVAGVGSLAVFTQRVLHIGPQQCVLRSAFGVPCPICGLSRCGLALAHLDPLKALRSDPLGVVVLVALALVTAATLLFATFGRTSLPNARKWGPALIGVVVVRWALQIVAAA